MVVITAVGEKGLMERIPSQESPLSPMSFRTLAVNVVRAVDLMALLHRGCLRTHSLSLTSNSLLIYLHWLPPWSLKLLLTRWIYVCLVHIWDLLTYSRFSLYPGMLLRLVQIVSCPFITFLVTVIIIWLICTEVKSLLDFCTDKSDNNVSVMYF